MDAGNAERLTEPDWAAFIAIDWADQKHDWAMEVPGQSKRERGQMAHTPEVIDTWVMQLRQRFAARPIAGLGVPQWESGRRSGRKLLLLPAAP